MMLTGNVDPLSCYRFGIGLNQRVESKALGDSSPLNHARRCGLSHVKFPGPYPQSSEA